MLIPWGPNRAGSSSGRGYLTSSRLSPASQSRYSASISRTITITRCNGSRGYLPDNASYHQVSYETLATRARRGCAEKASVKGLLEMMDDLVY